MRVRVRVRVSVCDELLTAARLGKGGEEEGGKGRGISPLFDSEKFRKVVLKILEI